MNDAEVRLAERLAGELESVLGTGILVRDLSIEGDGPVRIRVTCRAHQSQHIIEAGGDSVIDATTGILKSAAELRLTTALRELVG